MPDTDYTFSVAIDESPFEIVDDRTKPGWDDISMPPDDEEGEDSEEESG